MAENGDAVVSDLENKIIRQVEVRTTEELQRKVLCSHCVDIASADQAPSSSTVLSAEMR